MDERLDNIPKDRAPVAPRRIPPRRPDTPGNGLSTRPPVPRLALRHGALALIALSDPRREQEVARWIERAGGTAVAVPTDMETAATLADAADRWDFALIDSDAFGDPVEAHEMCLRLRNGAPGLPIILVDSELQPRDLTPLASGLCDALLATDFTETALAHAHQTATFAASFAPVRSTGAVLGTAPAAQAITAARVDRAPSGWWILPAVLLGAALWIAVAVSALG